MKKIIVLFLTAMLLCTFAGCGGKPVVGNTPTDKPVITLRYYQAGYGVEYIEKQIESFNNRARNGEYDFYVTGYPDPGIVANFGNLLDQAKESDKVVMPDVVLCPEINSNEKALKAGYLENLNSVWATEVETAGAPNGKMKIEDKIAYPELKAKYNFTGNYYGLPMMGASTGIIYNKKLFNEYGLKVPQTMAEMWTLLEEIDLLQRNIDSSINNDINAIVYPSMNIEYWDYITYTYWAQFLGVDAAEKFFNIEGINTKVVEYQKYYETIFNTVANFGKQGPGAGHAYTTASTHTLTLAAFAQQKALMTICGDWTKNEMGAIMSIDDIGFMPVPLICDLNTNKVLAKATPSSEVFEGVDMNDAKALKEIENKYFKIAISEVDPSVVPAEDKNADYIYFKKVMYTNVGRMEGVVPAKAKNKEYAKQFLAYLVSDEALDIYYSKTGSWLPYKYEYTEEDAKADGLPEFSITAQQIVSYDAIISPRYTAKGKLYNFLSHMQGTVPSYIVDLLENKVTANGLYTDIKTAVLSAYATLEDDIALYERVNEINW